MRLRRVEELDPELRKRWAAARVWAAHQAPYLATALLALDPVVVDQSDDPPEARADLRALPTDPAWHVYVDPAVLAESDVGRVGFWLLHQTTHLLRHHAERYPARERDGPPPAPPAGRTPAQRRWNVATDAEIDDDLHAGQVVVPEDAVTPERLGLPEGWVAEQYWDALGGPPGAPGSVPAAGGAATSGPTARDGHGSPDCGSGCDGCGRPWDCGRPGLRPSERRLLGRDVARRIRDHQRRRGDVPSGWERWADEVLDPHVDWRRVLRAAVRRGAAQVAGRVDFTYRRPSRRASAVRDVVLPSLHQPMPEVAVVVDTSGSMSDPMLGQALGEVTGVLRSLGTVGRRLRVVSCDAAAHEAQRIADARQVNLLGGGGTDMRAGIAAAADLRPRPDLVIVLTDGYTPWPPAPPPGVRVLVGLMDPNGTVPDWATSVLVEPVPGASGC